MLINKEVNMSIREEMIKAGWIKVVKDDETQKVSEAL